METTFNVQDHFKKNEVEKNKEIALRSSLNYTTMIVNLHGDKNIGTIIRTSSLMGVSKVFVIGRRVFDRRTMVGADRYIDIEKIMGFPDELLNIFKTYTPVCVEQGGVSLDEVNWSCLDSPPCFIMGAEDTGLSREFIKLCETVPGFMKISIPQHGVMRSLNVSTAHSIIVYEYSKFVRKQIAGKYV